jgi:hypothetical protein
MSFKELMSPVNFGVIFDVLFAARISPAGIENFAVSLGNCEESHSEAANVAA